MKMAWPETLREMPSTLKTLALDSDESPVRDLRIALGADRRTLRRASKRAYLNLLKVEKAAAAIERLPEAGESVHMVVRGDFALADVVSAVVKLIEPATIKQLDVATLGFNKRNAADLLKMIDDGKIGRVVFLASAYFRAMDDQADLYELLVRELKKRKAHRIAAVRTHAKILGFETTDGRFYCVESSANYRSCNNIEQIAIHADRALVAFHREWMNDAMARVNE